MVINTARLEPDNPTPAGLIWGQGPDFNSRLVTEINNENTSILFANYRLTVDDVTNALLNKQRSGVPVQLIIEPNEYLNRAWPEFWLTHANYDKLWAAGVQIKQRNHQGNMHMKTLITSTFATNASSNIAAAWQRDNDYFISAAGKPAVYTAVKNRVVTMWNDPAGFVPFQPGPPDAATLSSPGSGASQVPTNASLVWNIAAFATDYDVFMGLSQSSLTRVANVKAQMVNNPPSQYSWTPPGPLCTGTTYYWSILSRTNATPVNSSLSAQSSLQAFTTAGPNQGCSGMPGGSGNASGDFDGDGHPDLIWQSDASRQVTVWYMGAAGSNALVRANWIDPAGEPGWKIVAVADFNRDGKPDLVWQNDTTRQVTVWYMGGAGGATLVGANWIDPAGQPGWKVVAAADFNGDGQPDLVWQNDTTRQVTVWYMGGAGGATLVGTNWIDPAGQPGWKIVAAADFNRDGKPDLVWQSDASRQVVVWYMGGAAGATPAGSNWIDQAGEPGWAVVAAADFNGDGQPDLVWQNDTTRQVTVWYMGGAAGATLVGAAWIDQTGEPGWKVVGL
jgi:hypothetical protein